MNVFKLRNTLISDYATYIQSFVTIEDKRIEAVVSQEMTAGVLWPEPLIQLNPNFEPGTWIDDLVQTGKLHETAGRVFRVDKSEAQPTGKRMQLFRHQASALEAAQTGDNYVLTTGTGSGKSLAYIVPIVNHVLQRGSGRGIQAVIIYPMNALANSQENELKKFLSFGFTKPPVTFRRYTGQENDTERREIIENPPDILLTNYVMLELLLTRPDERDLVAAMHGLQFLVLDELHTYRGRQGADVAMLVRRMRTVSGNPSMQTVGTSATLAGAGTFAEQQVQVSAVATSLFGATVKPERIIGETLRRATPDRDIHDPDFVAELAARIRAGDSPSANAAEFVVDPLSIWIETTFGLEWEAENGRLKRAMPISIDGPDGAAQRLSGLTGVGLEQCQQAIQSGLMGGYQALDPNTGRPIFAFRLHQFISRGDMVYASLEELERRHITLDGQRFVSGDRSKILLPVAFCRECGQEYYLVRRLSDRETGKQVVIPRELRDQSHEDDSEHGFLYRNPKAPWLDDEAALIASDRLPEDWLEPGSEGSLRLKSAQRKRMPQRIRLNTEGHSSPDGLDYHFVQSPFRFCLKCGVTYGSRERSDFGKLAGLSSEGRSTATTVLSLSAYRSLKYDTALDQKAKKLLSFTDNRQDASLQAGHFNDFVEVGLLRAALYRAVIQADEDGLEHRDLSAAVFDVLDLPWELYASNTESMNRAVKRRTDEALRQILVYRLYTDLRRGWRLNAPNLEQCGLLQIEYPDLAETVREEALWSEGHETLRTASPETRFAVCKVLLDYFRRELAIRAEVLDPIRQEAIRSDSFQRLCEPWAIDEEEQMQVGRIAIPGPRRLRENSQEYVAVSSRSGFGQFLRRHSTFPDYGKPLNLKETDKVIGDLFALLTKEGLIEIVEEARDRDDVAGYQMPADIMLWKAGDGEQPFFDPVRQPRQSAAAVRSNRFFVHFYKNVAGDLKGVEAREHTAQVKDYVRVKREDDFREAKLPILYCSPTMELGVDISQLNVVNMRNVPPTPANYAQRSGRAGRSGQPALVFTYCTSGSPHDQYFFKRPTLMVAGAVTPPRLDLSNEDLIRSHVHAVWLAETGQSLHRSLSEILDLSGETPSLALRDSVRSQLARDVPRQRARERCLQILKPMQSDLLETGWYSEDWLDKTLAQALWQLDRACDRWRDLYRSAVNQRDTQHAIITDASRSPRDKEQARRLRGEAENQINLLIDSGSVMQSDFYSYRYFASEGFLPGYNFPRLPLSAFIPARRGAKRQGQDEYLSRPRFLAISEFGPRSIIYHEGSRYIINKVILPVAEEGAEANAFAGSARVCPHCGYLHPIAAGVDTLEVCDYCRARLSYPYQKLFRMQNVSTLRRDRINSDEEERVRMGYELVTSLRFEERDGQPAFATALVKSADGQDLLTLAYGDTATLWRINLGWRRRKDKADHGFVLDVERGYWARNEQEVEPDREDPESQRKLKVIPYVEDRRNSLLLKFDESYSVEVMASLQPALKNAIQICYQLEDNELAAEPLPDRDNRRYILLYESAEGGAGVLRQLVTDPEALRRVARTALELCHFDPDSREDRRKALHAKEECEAACYDCLMSYANQMDHQLLDRQLVLTPLYELANSQIELSPSRMERSDFLAELQAASESDLEREWLDFLNQRNLRLPDVAQKVIPQCNTRCDFYYSDKAVAIYVDGSPHQYGDVQRGDDAITDCLSLDLGLTVLRFRYDQREQWERILADHAYVFGKTRA